VFKLFGKTLKQLRNNANLTQQELATKLKVAPSTIGMYESDKRMPDTTLLSEIATLFNVSVDYLLGRIINDNFNDRFKKLRLQHNLTQQELAEALDINRTSISKYENGVQVPEVDVLKAIAIFFNVTVDYLLGTTDPNNLPLSQKEKKDISKDLDNIKKALLEEEELMFDGHPMSGESIDSIISALEIGMEMVRKKNKIKYNPYKNKKQ